ncbi:PHD finger protein EHD3-like [Bidens hawaiensis]|uniref:PHD finger protein EHD3-like n=1 Tax=Bidens hawaiensis TaxID=980011 RepID=UPI00404B3508
MGDDKQVITGDGSVLNCTKIDMGPRLLLDVEATTCEEDGLRTYKRRKRTRKMTTNSDHNNKIKAAVVIAFDQYKSSFDAISNGPGDLSRRKCNCIALEKTSQLLNGHEGSVIKAPVAHPESAPTPLIKESHNIVERSDKQTHNTSQEPSHVPSSGVLERPEGSRNSELCERALFDTLNSDKYSELRRLLLKNFGVVNVNRVTNVDSISSKLKSGAYETSPFLYLKDIQQVYTKLQQVGNEMVTLAKSLSDKSRAHFEQFVWKPEPCGCKGCGGKADAKNSLVCDSCEDIYHLSCTELVGALIPPKSWYCATCVSNGIGSHDNCMVCEKLKSTASVHQPQDLHNVHQSQDPLNVVTDESQSQRERPYMCNICKTEVKIDEKFRTCGHLVCPHKFYHDKCLTSKQLGVYGSCWYCPSCLCRYCLVDKDDDQIVLCDGCDQAYHIYCTSPQLDSIPEGNWFCAKCDRDLKRIRSMRMVYESMQKKVKVEDESAKGELEGLDMLVSAAKTLSHEDTGCNMR